jgi:hypothetical protein
LCALKEALCESLVHNRDGVSRASILTGELATPPDPDIERGEIARTDGHGHDTRRLLGRGTRAPLDVEPLFEPAT